MSTNSPALDMAEILASAGVGSLSSPAGWRIGVGKELEQQQGRAPHTCITLYDLPGTRMVSIRIQEPAIQVRVRGGPGDYMAAYAKAQEIAEVLLGISVMQIKKWIYSTTRMEGDVGFLGYDEANRPIFIATYKLMRSDLQ